MIGGWVLTPQPPVMCARRVVGGCGGRAAGVVVGGWAVGRVVGGGWNAVWAAVCDGLGWEVSWLVCRGMSV